MRAEWRYTLELGGPISPASYLTDDALVEITMDIGLERARRERLRDRRMLRLERWGHAREDFETLAGADIPESLDAAVDVVVRLMLYVDMLSGEPELPGFENEPDRERIGKWLIRTAEEKYEGIIAE